MRLVYLFIALVSLIVSGCDKADEEPEFAAHYKGTFIRTNGSPLNDPVASNVTLTFTKNTFSGTTDLQYYPALCNGYFDISQSKLTVLTNCFFTANFDETLIFEGDYQYELVGDHLRIWRDYANGTKDIYLLTKKD